MPIEIKITTIAIIALILATGYAISPVFDGMWNCF
jgi:hypothetical protein